MDSGQLSLKRVTRHIPKKSQKISKKSLVPWKSRPWLSAQSTNWLRLTFCSSTHTERRSRTRLRSTKSWLGSVERKKFPHRNQSFGFGVEDRGQTHCIVSSQPLLRCKATLGESGDEAGVVRSATSKPTTTHRESPPNQWGPFIFISLLKNVWRTFGGQTSRFGAFETSPRQSSPRTAPRPHHYHHLRSHF